MMLHNHRLHNPILLLVLFASLIPANDPTMGMSESRIFTCWEEVAEAPASDFFFAEVKDMHPAGKYMNNHPWLSEELLFIQSNTRILICQNPKGELRYAAVPTQVYPVPTDRSIPSGPGYGPGMYYHFDAARLMNIRYSFRPVGSDTAVAFVQEGEYNNTCYADHFLPLTVSRSGEMEAFITTFAPVSPDPDKAALSPAPLPGPPAAFYILYLKNTGTRSINGTVLLSCDKKLHDQETRMNIDRNTLILSIPEASAGIHMIGGTWKEEQQNYLAERDISLKPGEAVLIESFIVLGEMYREIMPVVYQLYLYSSLEWLNKTADFWNDRLGKLAVSAGDYPLATRLSRDIYYRCVLDNFCCLQADEKGNILSHYQGAPKQGTIWGIDYEPTIISAMQVAPELGRAGILFTMNRNQAPRTKYGNMHSVPILISPVMIARKYLEWTADTGFFTDHPDIPESLDLIMQDLLSVKCPDYTLFPTIFSSDGPVGRQYDHGTNVKVYYALEGYGVILDAMGEHVKARYYYQLAEEVRQDIDGTMVTEGPFGRQISGGTNLGSDPGEFYLNDSIIYYDGEDTGSHLAPVYGVYGWDYTPWVNYHRWARSLFCPSWEPEFGTLRWFPSWNMPVLDGTGWISALAGSVSRTEMSQSMEKLFRICDPTGSLYWWPMGYNFRQGLSRCSQGQGTWAWQYLEQWLGIKVNAMSRTLTISPQGLPDSISWSKMRAGNNLFDIFWQENTSGAECTVTNYNRDTWTVKIGCRQSGTGAGSTLIWETMQILSGQTATVWLRSQEPAAKNHTDPAIIAQTEIRNWGDEAGIVFIRYGTVDPFPDWYHLWSDEALDIRFYILNGTGSNWKETTVTLKYPDGWLAKSRKPGFWDEPARLEKHETSLILGSLPVEENRVAPFMVKGPHVYDHDFLTKGLPKHYPAEYEQGLILPTGGITTEINTEFEAVLRIIKEDGKRMEKKLVIPVKIVCKN